MSFLFCQTHFFKEEGVIFPIFLDLDIQGQKNFSICHVFDGFSGRNTNLLDHLSAPTNKYALLSFPFDKNSRQNIEITVTSLSELQYPDSQAIRHFVIKLLHGTGADL